VSARRKQNKVISSDELTTQDRVIVCIGILMFFAFIIYYLFTGMRAVLLPWQKPISVSAECIGISDDYESDDKVEFSYIIGNKLMTDTLDVSDIGGSYKVGQVYNVEVHKYFGTYAIVTDKHTDLNGLGSLILIYLIVLSPFGIILLANSIMSKVNKKVAGYDYNDLMDERVDSYLKKRQDSDKSTIENIDNQ